jgi:hypothetical protein
MVYLGIRDKMRCVSSPQYVEVPRKMCFSEKERNFLILEYPSTMHQRKKNWLEIQIFGVTTDVSLFIVFLVRANPSTTIGRSTHIEATYISYFFAHR